MKIEARLFFDCVSRYNKVAAADVKAFMVGKDFESMKADIKAQISTMQEGKIIVFLRTTATKTKTIMRQECPADEIQLAIDDWVYTKAYEKLIDQCLQYVYEKQAGSVV